MDPEAFEISGRKGHPPALTVTREETVVAENEKRARISPGPQQSLSTGGLPRIMPPASGEAPATTETDLGENRPKLFRSSTEQGVQDHAADSFFSSNERVPFPLRLLRSTGNHRSGTALSSGCRRNHFHPQQRHLLGKRAENDISRAVRSLLLRGQFHLPSQISSSRIPAVLPKSSSGKPAPFLHTSPLS